MNRPGIHIRCNTGAMIATALISTLLVAGQDIHGQGTRSDYERALNLSKAISGKVFKQSVNARWFDDGSRFWYRNDLPDGKHEYILIDADTGTRRRIDDRESLAKALGRTPGGSLEPEARMRRSSGTGEDTAITFVNRTGAPLKTFWINAEGRRRPYATVPTGGRHRQHTFAGHAWLVTDDAGKKAAAFVAVESPAEAIIEEETLREGFGHKGFGKRKPDRGSGKKQGVSPDGKWAAFVRDHDLFVREIESGDEFALSDDGTEDDRYEGRIHWSPDSKRIAVLRVRPAQEHVVHIIDSAPDDQVQPRLHSYDYLKPGDRIAVRKPRLFDVPGKKEIPVSDALFSNPWSVSDIRWDRDSSRFTFVYNQRGHQVLRVLAVDARDGSIRALIDEASETFIHYSGKFFLRRLEDTGEMIWMSERDGWNHLYLYDAATGRVKNRITKGEWVVRRVESVDEAARQVWFWAGGIRPGQDPYYLHLCRVGFDGSNLTVLTEGDGTHSVKFSPDRRYFVDRWSRVDHPPVTELRRSDDGKLVCVLERADWGPLLETGWRPPERVVARGRDGKTDIHGIIIRPSNFDPARSYPVIEEIYAGPHSAFVPKAFGLRAHELAMAELGFIVVRIDGMGTSHRSKAFHDVCWKNLGDSGFPDRILWMKAAAAKYPYMDLTRVGIYGGSAGGQSALRALLAHDDFYKAAAADCGCHDNRMDKIWWNEQWMGWPVGPHYEEQSNVTQAHRLQGKLLLTVGELDRNVDPASTMQVVDALVKADRDFELLIMPGHGHGAGETPYAARRRMDFFVRHLLGVEPRSLP